ncbi:MAG TPA: aldolase/citrate lyase family protein [Clostridia bacterium]|nr:aldolase/citrate lyase family protein [Clostridia bacterium]
MNAVKEKMLNKERPIGTFLAMATQSHVEAMGNVGLDYVVIDTEHGPYDTENMINLIRGTELASMTPFVRVANADHKEIQRCLDQGAKGLIIPMLNRLEDFKKVISLAKYKPIGNRGFAGVRSNDYGYDENIKDSIEVFMKKCNDEVLVLPQCETRDALEIIEEIVELEGVDGIFVGPFDLSISLGVPVQFDHPKFIKAIDRIIKACNHSGKFAIIYASNPQGAKEAFDKGFDSVAYNIDASIFIEGYKRGISEIRKLLKNS